MSLRFILCNSSHLSALRQISIQTFSDSFGRDNSEANMVSYLRTAFDEEKLRKELENPGSVFYLANAHRQVIGYLKLNVDDAQSENKGMQYLEIERIYLRKEFQGMGFGRELVQKAIETAREKGKTKIWLGVWEKNERALAFYKHFGFEQFETHTFKLGDEEQLDYLMELEIK